MASGGGTSASMPIGCLSFTNMPAQLEQLESLEQLRAMANGVAIHVAPATEVVPGGVDTPADLERLRKQLGGQV